MSVQVWDHFVSFVGIRKETKRNLGGKAKANENKLQMQKLKTTFLFETRGKRKVFQCANNSTLRVILWIFYCSWAHLNTIKNLNIQMALFLHLKDRIHNLRFKCALNSSTMYLRKVQFISLNKLWNRRTIGTTKLTSWKSNEH